MSPEQQAEATRLREVALHQAAHDCRGSYEPEDVVKRAQVYLNFLSDRGSGETLKVNLGRREPSPPGDQHIREAKQAVRNALRPVAQPVTPTRS